MGRECGGGFLIDDGGGDGNVCVSFVASLSGRAQSIGSTRVHICCFYLMALMIQLDSVVLDGVQQIGPDS